jgi:hypothetical protein
MFYYATILTYFPSIFIVAVNDAGLVKMYKTSSIIIITFLNFFILLNYVAVSTKPSIEN